jgi:hypothetical protein
MHSPKIIYSSNQAGYLASLYLSKKGYIIYSGKLRKRFYILFQVHHVEMLKEYFPKFILKDMLKKTKLMRGKYQNQFGDEEFRFLLNSAIFFEDD